MLLRAPSQATRGRSSLSLLPVGARPPSPRIPPSRKGWASVTTIYVGEFERGEGVTYHKYEMQPNGGDDIPTSIKNWRNKNGGTHAVMVEVFVRKDGTKEDVEAALEAAHKQIRGA